jgi:hypothetical protein
MRWNLYAAVFFNTLFFKYISDHVAESFFFAHHKKFPKPTRNGIALISKSKKHFPAFPMQLSSIFYDSFMQDADHIGQNSANTAKDIRKFSTSCSASPFSCLVKLLITPNHK